MKNISVIVPIYNPGPWLRPCLDSICVQNGMKNNELILVDDASTDGSDKIIAEYAEKYDFIVPFYKRKNEGDAEARNLGMLASTGEKLIFHDNDDAMGFPRDMVESARRGKISYSPEHGLGSLADKDFLNKLDDAVKKFDADIAYGEKATVCNRSDLDIIEQDFISYEQTGLLQGKAAAFEQASRRDSANCALYKRDFLKRKDLYFEPELRRDSDNIFSKRASYYANKIVQTHGAVYLQNYRQGSICEQFEEDLEGYQQESLRTKMVLLYYMMTEKWLKDVMFIELATFDTPFDCPDAVVAPSPLEDFVEGTKICVNPKCEICPHFFGYVYSVETIMQFKAYIHDIIMRKVAEERGHVERIWQRKIPRARS